MVESQVQFDSVRALAVEIARLTRVREEDQAPLLKAHSAMLNAIVRKLDLIEERTKSIDLLTERVGKLEQWRWSWAGFTTAALLFGGMIGWGIEMLNHH